MVNASVAQLVEQRTENPRVVGSIPTGGTKTLVGSGKISAELAHLVERNLAKVEVAGSSPVFRSTQKISCSTPEHDIFLEKRFFQQKPSYGTIAKW